jgi:hypothetical protein
MSYTFSQVVMPGAVPEPVLIQAVTRAAPSHSADRISELWVAPVSPKPGLAILHIDHMRGTERVKGTPVLTTLPAGFSQQDPFLFHLADLLAEWATPITALVVTDQSDEYAVVRLGPQVTGARASAALLGSFKTFCLEGGVERRDSAAENVASELLSLAVGEAVSRPLAYLQWYADWFEGELGDTWATAQLQRPIRLRASGGQLGPPEFAEPAALWNQYFPE